MALKNDQSPIKIKNVQDIGSTIVSDTIPLESHVQSFWQQSGATHNSEAGKDIHVNDLLNDLPACLQDDFKNYELHQKSELDELLQNRQHIGHLLKRASSLIAFQAQLSQLASNDIYRANTCYRCGSIPDYLRISDDVTSSESK